VLVESGDTIDGKVLTSIEGFIPAINNNGTIAFVAHFQGGSGVFTHSHLLAKAGDTIGGATISSFRGPVGLDANGTVVFSALISGGGAGIFTPTALILKSGDTLEGRTISTVVNSNAQINSPGQIAMNALSAGPTGPPFAFVVIADPLLNVSIAVNPPRQSSRDQFRQFRQRAGRDSLRSQL
jgi:hypothetical protein